MSIISTSWPFSNALTPIVKAIVTLFASRSCAVNVINKSAYFIYIPPSFRLYTYGTLFGLEGSRYIASFTFATIAFSSASVRDFSHSARDFTLWRATFSHSARDFALWCATLRFGARLCALVRDFSPSARDFSPSARDFSALARDFALWCATSPLRRATLRFGARLLPFDARLQQKLSFST